MRKRSLLLRFIIFGFLIQLIAGCDTDAVSSDLRNENSYDLLIYEASIAALGKASGEILIEDRTVTLRDLTDDWAPLSQLLLKNLPDLSYETLESFRRKNLELSLLKSDWTPNPPFLRITEDERDTIEKMGWAEFYSANPNVNGLYKVSRIGIDSTETMALVYVHHRRSYNIGAGVFLLLRRDGGRWLVKQTYEFSSN